MFEKIYRQADPNLSPAGIEGTLELGKAAKDIHIDHLLCSAYTRAI